MVNKKGGGGKKGGGVAKMGRDREGGVKVDLHSYGGSAQSAEAIFNKHPNVYFSFSTIVNSRSPKLNTLIATIPEDRLLVESDFNQADQLDQRVWDMVKLVAEVKGWSEERTVEVMESNWRRFAHQ